MVHDGDVGNSSLDQVPCKTDGDWGSGFRGLGFRASTLEAPRPIWGIMFPSDNSPGTIVYKNILLVWLMDKVLHKALTTKIHHILVTSSL